MTQRIHDRLNNGLDNEILVNAIRTGEYVDQFTTDCATSEETKATLERLPKCMQEREDECPFCGKPAKEELTCPECMREGCFNCMPAGKGCICPECEEKDNE